jgi:hypothetical protein
MSNPEYIVAACTAMVLLVLVVGLRLMWTRVSGMRQKRIHPQAVATAQQMTARLPEAPAMQAADNFRNLFEVPVLFYALCALSLATGLTPYWLVAGLWLFVALRGVHSFIHCTYNKVMHRFAAFVASFLLLVLLWVAFFLTYLR